MSDTPIYPPKAYFVPPPNDASLSYWLYGARVWAEYQITGRRLWEFRGYERTRDIFLFQDRQHLGVLKFFSPAMLMAAPNFRPFCIDTAMMHDSNPVHARSYIPLKRQPSKGLMPNAPA